MAVLVKMLLGSSYEVRMKTMTFYLNVEEAQQYCCDVITTFATKDWYDTVAARS